MFTNAVCHPNSDAFLLGIAFLLPSVLVLTYVPITSTIFYYYILYYYYYNHYYSTCTRYIHLGSLLSFLSFTSSTSFLRHNLPAFPPRPKLISARPVQSSIYFSFSFFFPRPSRFSAHTINLLMYVRAFQKPQTWGAKGRGDPAAWKDLY